MVRAAAFVLLTLCWACEGGGVDVPLGAPGTDAGALQVRILDVGQGDAIVISGAGSTVILDGGPDQARFGSYLDELGLNGGTVDAVILSHVHPDHHRGLRALFESRRGIRIRRFIENGDAFESGSLRELRDSVQARAARGELELRDSNDPCGSGRPICTLELGGGARLHVLRPDPDGRAANDRSTAVKLVGPDSAAFSMWFAGDAEREQIEWFERSGYVSDPGMRVSVLKANHHGDCNGVTGTFLSRTSPRQVVISLGSDNAPGFVHQEMKALLRGRGVDWLRTDRNGTLTIRVPGRGGADYDIEGERGGLNLDGAWDRSSPRGACTT